MSIEQTAAKYYRPETELRLSLQGMKERIEGQLAETEDLSANGNLGRFVLALLVSALQSGITNEQIYAGRQARHWILDNASEDERLEWEVGMPHPDLDRYEVAVAYLTGEFTD